MCVCRQFNCTSHSANGQCYRFKSLTNTQSDCDAVDGYYKHGYCYYDCPDDKYLLNDQCYNQRSARYSQHDCRTVGGYHSHGFCYLARCNYFPVNDHCYRYKTTSFSNGTCESIGGFYAAETAEPSHHFYCYYTSFSCRDHAVNGQCYSRASNHSETVCKTIPGSYYDVGNNTCYFYCTEVMTLDRCVVGSNASFSRETCDLIGGIYSGATCYYVTLHCPNYRTNDGQCYANRSADLTCDTCRHIGRQYEDGACYYYRYNCSAYSVDGQCYTSRMTIHSDGMCDDMGGLFHTGYCYYYQQSECRSSQYRNCTCFRHRSGSKTVGTCANIGGYYDFRIRQCFYNSTTCQYYGKNDQCYRHRSPDFSGRICSNIGGYYTQESSGRGRYISVCYFNELNCSNWANDRCYLQFSSSYNEGTCASISGYYSQNDRGCYYNSFSACNYPIGGQCYDGTLRDWSRTQCEDANGYFYRSRCYVSNYYCPHVVNRQCYLYKSSSYDCNSCRLLDGFMFSDSCYYSSADNCSEPLFQASNGQCYDSCSSVRTAAECRAMPGESYYDDGLCYSASGSCSSGHFVNCQCYIHRSVRVASWFYQSHQTRKLCYRKDDRAMRPIYGYSENVWDSLTIRPVDMASLRAKVISQTATTNLRSPSEVIQGHTFWHQSIKRV